MSLSGVTSLVLVKLDQTLKPKALETSSASMDSELSANRACGIDRRLKSTPMAKHNHNNKSHVMDVKVWLSCWKHEYREQRLYTHLPCDSRYTYARRGSPSPEDLWACCRRLPSVMHCTKIIQNAGLKGSNVLFRQSVLP